jgi:polyvinyl alcohol dehydrogenase (cytochrome)
MKKRTAVVALITSVGALAVPSAIARTPVHGCAGAAKGGQWRSYGHDFANSRHQPAEHTITAANAGSLKPKWVFDDGGNGQFNGTPIVADGCVFAASQSGAVYAINADTGQVVWQGQLPDPIQTSPAVSGGRVFVTVTRGGAPYIAALNEKTGATEWTTRMVKAFGTDTNSSPVVYRGLVIAGVSGASAEAGTTLCPGFAADTFGCGGGPDSRLKFRGVYVIIDAATGKLLRRGHSIPDKAFKAGYSGGGIWATAAVDTKRGYAYFGTGNPFSAHEYKTTNAIIKVDVDRQRKTFGRVVGSYHGTNDLYISGSAGKFKPVCQVYVDVFTCDPPDFDFGASPQLFTVRGHRYVGDMQKAGVYHVADARTMKGVWHTIVGGPFGQVGGMATASYDGHALYTGGSAPGIATSLVPGSGARNWVAPIADGVHFQSMSTAGGVAYTVDSRGILDGWDTATGRQVLTRPVGSDIHQPTYNAFSATPGVAIARHTVYVTASGSVIAYRPA